jgi:hypothetical protein
MANCREPTEMATTASNTPALEISNLEAWYGESRAARWTSCAREW